MLKRNYYITKTQDEQLKLLSKNTGLDEAKILRRALDNYLSTYIPLFKGKENRNDTRNNQSK